MLKSYLLLPIRNLFRNKIISFITIVGLAISFGVSFNLFMYVAHELSVDKYNKNYSRIYRLNEYVFNGDIKLPYSRSSFAEQIKQGVPDVDETVRIKSAFPEIQLDNGEKMLIENSFFADPSIFNVFSLKMLKGNEKYTLLDPYSIIIDENLAMKIFNTTEVLGKMLKCKIGNSIIDLKITGVLKHNDYPSTIHFENLLPMTLCPKIDPFAKESYASNGYFDVITYFLLKNNSGANKVNNFVNKYLIMNDIDISRNNISYKLMPISEIYLHSNDFINDFVEKGDIKKIYIFSSIGFLILLMACFNYIILTTSRSTVRAKEIGVKKVIGAGKIDLIKQGLTESVGTVLLALPLAIYFLEFSKKYFGELLGKDLSTTYFYGWKFFAAYLLIAVIIGIVSGIYVAFYLNSFHAVDLFRKNVKAARRSITFREVLIGLQAVIFIGMIMAFVTICKQMEYTKNKDFGFNKENLYTIYGIYSLNNKAEVFKEELLKYHGVKEACLTSASFPELNFPRLEFPRFDAPSQKTIVYLYNVGYNYPEFLHLKLKEGRMLTQDDDGQTKNVLINETAVRELGLKNPIGTVLTHKLFGKSSKRVVGVVEDFNFRTFKEKIAPVILSPGKNYSNLVLRINPADISGSISFIKKKWKEFSDKPLDLYSLDEKLERIYKDDLQFSEMIKVFTICAIMLASLGFLGIILITTNRKIKEIGIRRVLGASITDIIVIISKQFFILITIAAITAAPVIYYLIGLWLQEFAYKIGFGFGVIFISTIAAYLITFLTIFLVVFKAATADPVEALRYE